MAKKKKPEQPAVEETAKAPAMIFDILVDRGTIHRPQWQSFTWDGGVQVEGGVLILKRDGIVVEAFSVAAWKTIKARN